MYFIALVLRSLLCPRPRWFRYVFRIICNAFEHKLLFILYKIHPPSPCPSIPQPTAGTIVRCGAHTHKNKRLLNSMSYFIDCFIGIDVILLSYFYRSVWMFYVQCRLCVNTLKLHSTVFNMYPSNSTHYCLLEAKTSCFLYLSLFFLCVLTQSGVLA